MKRIAIVVVLVAMLICLEAKTEAAGLASVFGLNVVLQQQVTDTDPGSFVDMYIYPNYQVFAEGKNASHSGMLYYGSDEQGMPHGNFVKIFFEPTGLEMDEMLLCWMRVRGPEEEEYTKYAFNKEAYKYIPEGTTVNEETIEVLLDTIDDLPKQERADLNSCNVFYLNTDDFPKKGLVRIQFGFVHKGNKKNISFLMWNWIKKVEGRDMVNYCFRTWEDNGNYPPQGFSCNVGLNSGQMTQVLYTSAELMEQARENIDSYYFGEQITEEETNSTEEKVEEESSEGQVQKNVVLFDDLVDGQSLPMKDKAFIDLTGHQNFHLLLPEGFAQREFSADLDGSSVPHLEFTREGMYDLTEMPVEITVDGVTKTIVFVKV